MRRIHALLLAAGLGAAPAGAAAESSRDPSPPSASTFERFEWSTSKGRLGVMVMSLTPELRKHFGVEADRGVLVARVEPGTPAALAGLTVGDIVVEVRGRAIADAGDVLSALAGAGKGADVAVKLVRDRQPLTVHATLTDHPPRGLEAMPLGRDWVRELMKPFRSRDPSWFDDWLGPEPEREHESKPRDDKQPAA